MADLKGRVAIVTGAGRGIGRAISQRLAACGAKVVLAARNAVQLNETHRLIEGQGGEALAVPTDVSNEQAVQALIAKTIDRFKRVDILVNNAGVALAGTVESMTPESFGRLLDTNIRSVYLCCRAVWPHMRKAGSGAIINISSIAAHDPFPGLGAYGATKSFVGLYTKAMAVEGAPLGIRVHAIAPGAVETHMLRGLFPEFPAGQALAPEDVAEAVEMMLTPAAANMSGQSFVVNKG